MQKLDPKSDGASPDLVEENIETLRELFPEAFTEGSDPDGPRWKVDFDALRELLGDQIEQRDERYGLIWHGKASARRLAQTPSTGTLRPCLEESVNWDSTGNLFIEGDNLEVLKLLQKSYHKQVKMIYIDPPYNTGGEFVYPDRFQDSLDSYLRYTGQKDESGASWSANPEGSGRYHTNWLNMMYPRLRLARNILSVDGTIFISIDDHEFSNLKAICDEIFGEENFLTTIVWEKVHTRKNSSKYFSQQHDYVIAYARNKEKWDRILLPRENTDAYTNPDDDPKGPWKADPITAHNYYSADYVITKPNGTVLERPTGRYWALSQATWSQKVEEGAVLWGEGDSYPMVKRYLSEVQEGLVPVSLFSRSFAGDTAEAKREIDEVLGVSGVFDYPKPSRLLQRLIQITMRPDDIALDFFAGSNPLSQAIVNQNSLDDGSRRFISVQIPEPCKDSSGSYNAGYRTIADLGKERTRRVVGADDSGCRVFKLATTNLVQWDPSVDALEVALWDAIDNVKPERSEEDLLYELLLKYGLDLSLPVEERPVAGRQVFIVGGGALVACLSDRIDPDVVQGIAALKSELAPEVMRVVFKDSGFSDDVVKTNTVQILQQAGIEDVRSLPGRHAVSAEEGDKTGTADGEDIASARGEFLVYHTEDGQTRVECRFEEETIWLSQGFLAELYQTSKQNISLHLRNLFKEGELRPEAVVKEYLTTAPDGKSYRVKHYSLEAILAVGYRVRSYRGTEFRRWATDRLREYLTKGFAMDDERLKNPPVPGSGLPDYFDELLDRIRDIRASERRMYLRVREIFRLAADYDPSADETTRFFQHMQNKLHYAATGETAAELIHGRADHTQPNMGLTNWKGDQVRSADVTVAKNYLSEPEIDELNRIVTMWLDFAEDQARRRRQVFMQDWQDKLDQFLEFNDRSVLSGHGGIRKSTADDKARAEYQYFEERRRALRETAGEEETLRALEDWARRATDSDRTNDEEETE